MSIEPLAESELSTPVPEEYSFVGGFKLDVGDEPLAVPAQLAIPVPDGANLEPGTEVFFLRKGELPDETGTLNPMWFARESGIVSEDGQRILTQSPPWPGAVRSGEFSLVVPTFEYSVERVLVALDRAMSAVFLTAQGVASAYGITSHSLLRQLTGGSGGNSASNPLSRGVGLSRGIGQVTDGVLQYAEAILILKEAARPRVNVVSIPRVGLPFTTESGVELNPGQVGTLTDIIPPPADPDAVAITKVEVSVSPDAPEAGPVVFLTGENFGTNLDNLTVQFHLGDKTYEGEILPQLSQLTETDARLAVVTDKVPYGEARVSVEKTVATLEIEATQTPEIGLGRTAEETLTSETVKLPVPDAIGLALVPTANGKTLNVLNALNPHEVVAATGSQDLLQAKIPLGEGIDARPKFVANTSDATRAYVTLEDSAKVAVVDLLGLRQVDALPETQALDAIDLPVNAFLTDIAIGARDRYAYVADGRLGAIYVIDIDPNSETFNQHIDTLDFEGGDKGLNRLAVSPDGTRLFATTDTPKANSGNSYGQLLVFNIDPADRPLEGEANPRRWHERIAAIETSWRPEGLAATPDPNKMVFTNRNEDGKGYGVLSVTHNDPSDFQAAIHYTPLSLGSSFDDFDVNEAVEVVVVPYEDTHYAFVAGHNYRALGLGLPGWNGKGNIGIIKDALSDNPQLVAGTRSLPEAQVNGVALSGDGKALYAAYPGLESTFVFDVEQMLATASNPSHWEDLRSQPIEELNSNIFLAGRLRTIENPATGEQRYEVDPDDPLAPLSTEGEDYSVTVASTIDVVSLNSPPSDDLTPTLTWDFEEIDEDDISEIHVFVSTFEEGEGLFPWDEVVDLSDNSVLPNLSSSEKRDLLTRDWNGYDDFNPGRILTATWRDGQWYSYDGSTLLATSEGAPPNTATQLTLPDDRQLMAGQTYHWGVEAISRSGEVETETQVLQTYSSLDYSTPFSSVSILTHGFTLLPVPFGIPQSFYKMADKIANVTTGADSAGLILRYDKREGVWVPTDSSGNIQLGLIDSLNDIKNANDRPSYLNARQSYLDALKQIITEKFIGGNPDRPKLLKPLVLLPEWSSGGESVISDTGFTEGAADAIFASLVELDRLLGGSAQYDPEQGKFIREQGAVFDSPLHFIGFSRGTVVNSEIVQRLGTYYPDAGVREEGDGDLHMTTIDPHDFKQENLGSPIADFSDFQEPEVRVWDNITFADNYYQTVADEQGTTLTPNGRSLGNVDESQEIDILTPDGADLNYRLNDLSGFKPDDRVGGPHLKALSWYAGTVDLALEELQLPSQLDRAPLPRTEPIYDRRGDSDLPEILGDDFSGSSVRPWYSSLDGNKPEEGTGHGWFYSVLGGGQGRRPGWSEYPNPLIRRQTSVKDDNTAQSYMKGDFAVPTLFNGNFDVAIVDENDRLSRKPWFSTAIPGWSFHNGKPLNLSATTDNLVERSDIPNLNSFDRSGTQPDFALHLNPGQNNSITHNRFLIPDSGSLHLDVFVPDLKAETEEERNRLLLQTGNYIDISLEVDGQQYTLESIAEPSLATKPQPKINEQKVVANTDLAVDLRPSYLKVEPEVTSTDIPLWVQENLNRVDYGAIGFETFVVNVPSEVRGKPGLLKIEVKGNKSIYLDNVLFSSKHTQSGIPILDGFESRKEAVGHENNYLIEKPQYVVSYNNEAKNANWVSFQLNQSWLSGKQKRPDNFVMDLTLPDEFAPHPVTEDYRGGWAQGHLTAATDRTRTEKDYMATFILSNINPQYQTVNEGIWDEFEKYLQEQANLEKDVHIITGSYGEQEQISDKEIRVPKYFWKVALILNKPGLNLAEIQAEDIENVIAVRMPNTREDLPQETTTWQDWTRTVEFIEDQTNLIFFNRLPNQLASNLKKYEVKFKNKKGEKPNPKSFK